MRQEKQFLLDEIKDQIKSADSFVIMRYQRFDANTANNFRREIAEKGGSVEVVPKRVLLKAAEKIGLKLELSALTGHIGLIFTGSDPIETTKQVFKFSQNTDKTIEVLGGHFEGQLYSGADVEMLSKLPSRDEMRAQLLGTFEAPMSQMLAVVEALLTSVVHCLNNKVQQENQEK